MIGQQVVEVVFPKHLAEICVRCIGLLSGNFENAESSRSAFHRRSAR